MNFQSFGLCSFCVDKLIFDHISLPEEALVCTEAFDRPDAISDILVFMELTEQHFGSEFNFLNSNNVMPDVCSRKFN